MLLDLSVAFNQVDHFLLEETSFLGFHVECPSSIFCVFLDTPLMCLFVDYFSTQPLIAVKCVSCTGLPVAVCHRASAYAVSSA